MGRRSSSCIRSASSQSRRAMRIRAAGTAASTASPNTWRRRDGRDGRMRQERKEGNFGERTLARASNKRRGLSLSGRGYSERTRTRVQRGGGGAGALTRRAFFTGRYAKRDDLSRRERREDLEEASMESHSVVSDLIRRCY